MPLAIFVDYDGTITDVDTFDVLVRAYAGSGVWDDLETQLASGSITLKTAMERQASYVRGTLDDADALLAASVVFDGTFATFARACRRRSIPLTVVSSGLRPLIERALRRNDIDALPLSAGDVCIARSGEWNLRYPGDSPNGIDKAALVALAREEGYRTVYAGDGRSDFEAALMADIRFAKKGKALERYLTDEGLAFTAFTSFADVQRALF